MTQEVCYCAHCFERGPCSVPTNEMKTVKCGVTMCGHNGNLLLDGFCDACHAGRTKP